MSRTSTPTGRSGYNSRRVRKPTVPRALGGAVAGAVLTLLAAHLAPPAMAAPRELVVAHEILAQAGEHLDSNLAGFLRRVEEVAGWPKGSLRGKAFVRPRDALAYIKKSRAGFAILPVHQFVEAQRELKLEPLGRAVGVDGSPLVYSTVTRRPRSFGQVAGTPGLRVGATEVYDPVWVKILTEGAIDKDVAPVALVEVPSDKAGVEAVLAKKVDLAIVSELEYRSLKPRIEPTGDLEWLLSSPHLPPSAFVAVGKYVNAADRKKMAGVLDKICKTTGGSACARLGILYIEAGRAESYQGVLELYQRLKGGS
jgi:hypothetical protein